MPQACNGFGNMCLAAFCQRLQHLIYNHFTLGRVQIAVMHLADHFLRDLAGGCRIVCRKGGSRTGSGHSHCAYKGKDFFHFCSLLLSVFYPMLLHNRIHEQCRAFIDTKRYYSPTPPFSTGIFYNIFAFYASFFASISAHQQSGSAAAASKPMHRRIKCTSCGFSAQQSAPSTNTSGSTPGILMLKAACTA